MKVIKHLKKDSPDYRLKVFFKEMPLVTRILILSIFATSLILLITSAPEAISFYSILDARPISEIIFFIFISLTDFSTQEKRGSSFFFLGYIIRIGFLILANLPFCFFNFSFPVFSLNVTSIPIQYCLLIAFGNMISEPSHQRYFICEPFQIKAAYYPLFLVVVLELLGLRIDVLIPLVLAFIQEKMKFDNILMFLGRKVDGMFLTQRALQLKIIKTGQEENISELDQIPTANSAVLQQ